MSATVSRKMVIVPAYAKVNLALEVVARRADGYHDVVSVITTIDWHDLVGVRLTEDPTRSPHLHLSGATAPGIPTGAGNLAMAAAEHLRRATEETSVIDVWLDKRIPELAGLGGGSADAAAVLRAGAALLATVGDGLDASTLHRIAVSLGSDVPAALHGGAVMIRGRGDDVTALAPPRLHLAVAMAGASSTAAAYGALRPEEIGGDGRVERLTDLLRAGVPPIPEVLGSGLEAAACRAAPPFGDGLVRLRASTPEAAWHLTGSGGAAFAIAGDAIDAQRLAERARNAGFVARACRTVG